MMVTKSDQVRELVAKGEYKKALNIVKGFRLGMTKEQKDAVALAYECMVRPEFYRQLGKNIEQSIHDGIAVLDELYGPDIATL